MGICYFLVSSMPHHSIPLAFLVGFLFWMLLARESYIMQVSMTSVMAMKSYKYQTELLVKDYLLADPVVPYTSVLCGMFMCKMTPRYNMEHKHAWIWHVLVYFGIYATFGTCDMNMAYEFTQLISSFYFKGYTSLTKIQRIEWNNRGMSSAHAFFIGTTSIYLVFFSDLYSDQHKGPVTFRSSNLSTFMLGVSIGYFITDLAMIFWLYPLMGGIEYVFHHILSLCAITYAMMTGEGQLYTYMVLISEATTPGVNLRWFLDTAGMKRSNAYLVNGIMMFFAWLVARIFLFIYLFYHIYVHYEQVIQMHTFGYLLALGVPTVLGVMNLVWFGKILRGLRKQLAKRQ